MKKIGIITWFKYENYGTALQAISLQKFLRNNGEYVELIDFDLNDENLNIKKNKDKLIKKIYLKFGRFVYKIQRKKYKDDFVSKSNNFKKIIFENCLFSRKIENDFDYVNVCNSYDILLFGSDQIWNPSWYHPYYYANYESINAKRVAYAPSFGVNKIVNNKKEIRNALKRFSSIAVREKTGCDIVKKISGCDSSLVLDPTFLLSSKEWEKFESSLFIDEKYILCYFLSDNFYHWTAVKRFAKEKKLKLVVIPQNGFSYIMSDNVIRKCGVDDFLSLIHNAEFVITDSFHGTVFSIIYRKKFVVFERHDNKNILSQNSRIYDLLKLVKLENYILKYNSSKIIYNKNIPFNHLYDDLKKYIILSKDFLNKNIK